jgi:hypothetical protein
MAYQVIWEPKGVTIRFYETASWADLENYKRELFSDDRFDDIRYQIFDALDLIHIKVSGQEAVQGAYLDRASARSNPRCKIAAVTRDEHAAMLASLYGYALQAPGWDFKQFNDLDAARAWVTG